MYKNLSDPKLSSKNIEWVLKVPYIFYIKGTLFWEGWSIGGSFLIFNFYLLIGVKCGRRIVTEIKKWVITLLIYGPWVFSFSIGIYDYDYKMWKVKRRCKRDPEARERVRVGLAKLRAMIEE